MHTSDMFLLRADSYQSNSADKESCNRKRYIEKFSIDQWCVDVGSLSQDKRRRLMGNCSQENECDQEGGKEHQ